MNLGISSQAWEAEADRTMVRCPTVGINAADTIETAGVLTAVANARLIIGTGIVGATGIDTGSLLTDAANGAVTVMEAEFLPRHSAFNVGVTAEPCWTCTDGLVADREAPGVLAADAWGARVTALPPDAGLVEGAVSIAAASLNTAVCFTNLANIAVTVVYAFWWGPNFNLVTEVVWVALVSRLASTVRSMNDRTAVSVSATRVLNATRVDTLSIHTRLVKGAVRVTATSNNTFSPFTNLSGVASRISGAAIKDTDAVATDVSLCAGLINAAFDTHHRRCWRWYSAVDSWVAHFVPGTRACCSVVLWSTEGIDTAASTLVAWVATGTLHAGLVIWTVLVYATANNAAVADANLLKSAVLVRVAFNRHFPTVNLCVSFKVWWATAFRRVADCLAVCVHTADTWPARILAQLISAFQEEVAVAVRSTPGNASSVVADLSSVAVIVGSTEIGGRTLAAKADQTGQAVFIHATALTLLAFKLRIAIETSWTETVGAMMFRNTVSMDATGSTNAAWILALALIASLVDGAVLVTTATIEASM